MRKPERTKKRSTPLAPKAKGLWTKASKGVWGLAGNRWEQATPRTAKPRTPSSAGRWGAEGRAAGHFNSVRVVPIAVDDTNYVRRKVVATVRVEARPSYTGVS